LLKKTPENTLTGAMIAAAFVKLQCCAAPEFSSGSAWVCSRGRWRNKKPVAPLRRDRSVLGCREPAPDVWSRG
jgi:hypothetical protein